MSRLGLRYVVVGLGNLGAKRKTVLGERCVATVDPFNLAADHRSPEECEPGRYDAAILAVPNDDKIGLAHFFLTHGKHVLVEKPFVLDPATAAGLTQRSATTGAIWYTAYNFRFEPHVVALKRHLDAGAIGRVYRARMFYGNGSAGEIAGTWRDSRLGILEDMASHLIDLAGFVFGKFGSAFRMWQRRRCELLKGPDHCVLASKDGTVVIDCSFLSWKNRWRIEVTGQDGALEMDGLTKWGRSELVLWRRWRPSGAPGETRVVVEGPDPTWATDLRHFESCVAAGRTSCENDLWVSRVILDAADADLA